MSKVMIIFKGFFFQKSVLLTDLTMSNFCWKIRKSFQNVMLICRWSKLQIIYISQHIVVSP